MLEIWPRRLLTVNPSMSRDSVDLTQNDRRRIRIDLSDFTLRGNLYHRIRHVFIFHNSSDIACVCITNQILEEFTLLNWRIKT